MNIGFVSTWFERGAAYVTKAYISLLEEENNVFIYARGGEMYAKGDPKWDLPNVTWGFRTGGDSINYPQFKKWVKKNKLDVVFFNEQRDTAVLHQIKEDMPNIRLGAYIDYYKEDTVKEFWIYDFLICNTKRHYSVFKEHKQCFYVPWGTDTNLFKPISKKNEDLTFFHSAGMSLRKGTEYVIDAFIKGEIYKKAKLIIHTQLKLKETFGYTKNDLEQYNIEIIEDTISAPGLYYLGDVYVYPTKLDGLGLTMYEALSCGLPIIASDNPPMNEIVTNDNGYLVEVSKLISRSDGYYWPLSIVDTNSLIASMNYFIDNKEKLYQMKIKNRNEAVKNWEWQNRKNKINKIFRETKVIVTDSDKTLIKETNKFKKRYRKFRSSIAYVILSQLKRKLFKN